jgi:hypothetical protein
MDPKHVEIDNAYTENYKQILQKIQNDDKQCPFCEDAKMKHHKHPIEITGKYWLVTRNTYNYQEAQYPYLFIHKKHITEYREISTDAWIELQILYLQLINKYNILGGTIFLRFGEPKSTRATVTHLHAHLVASDPNRPNSTPIAARIG